MHNWGNEMRRTRAPLAVATALALGVAGLPAAFLSSAHAAVAPVGNGFTVTTSDLAFILKQIKISEQHANAFVTDTPPNPNKAGDPEYCQALLGTGADHVPDILTSYGLRTVDGQCNNLKAGQAKFAAADVPFPRLTTPVFRDAEPISATLPVGPPGPTSYKQKLAGNVVIDTQPRVISNLIVDQTSTNPAALAAAAFPVRTQSPGSGLFPCTIDPDPLANPVVIGVPANCVPSHKTLFIPNVTTDVGLSPPFNSLFTFFGQFFDHGVDQTVKSGATVFVPLRPDDPLITLGPDGKPNTGDEVPPSKAFMVLTRAQNQPGPDGVIGTADDIQDANNTDTPWVDQSQTYSSHASHQVFLREYVQNAAGRPVSTGSLLGGLGAGLTYLGSPDGRTGIGTWAAVKQQAATLLGLQLVDRDVTNIPMLATDPYGKFVPGPARGLPQYVTATGLVEGDTLNPVLVPANTVHFDTPFLTDIAHNADPSPQTNPQTGAVTVPTPDADVTPSADFASQPPGTYDDEMLNAHFICGDGRCNENIALSSIHQVFHSEHNRLVRDMENTLTQDSSATGLAALADWKSATGTPAAAGGWNGERVFQAARFVTEMEYQHAVFEEFARKVQPLVRPFHVYTPDVNAAVKAEFAHAVYRFGHSMLDDTVARTNIDKSDNSVPLLKAFLNPPEFFNGGTAGTLTPEQAAGSVIMGSSDQIGNELDEFVTETLRNNLLGLPLDLPTLNLTRAREAGVPPLNDVRRQLHATTNDGALAPYTSWSDFGQHLKHAESLINFVAAYGTHPTVRDSGPDGILGNTDDVTTLAAKRNAARAIVNPSPGNPTASPPVAADVPPPDAADFMFGTGAYADAGGKTTTGLDDVDLWVGGLAEVTNLNGGLLGSTFNYVFQNQLENLQEGDRLYYLARTPGMNLRSQLEGNSFAELVQRNTDGTNSLKADSFATADCRFQLANLGGTPADFTLHGTTVADDPASPCDESKLLLRKPDGTIAYRLTNTVDPPGINKQSVYNGTPGADRVTGGVDNDTIWGGAGNDVLEGGGGDDVVLGGDGNDIITDLNGADVLKGGPGNDAIDAGPGNDIVLGGDGQDFLNGWAGDNEIFAGPGNDFIIAGQGADAVFGDGGDDWIEGGTGQDLLQGDHGAPFFDDPGQTAPGNDIMIGQPGENDYDAEGGDDVMAQNAAIDRNAGAGGFDWAIHQYNTIPADDDMMINNNLGGLPIQVIVNRDRWQETEADSGGAFNDIIKGTDGVLATPRLIGGGGFQGCDALDQAGVARIKGLDQLLPPVAAWLGTAAAVAAISVPHQCPLTGPVWGEGDILMGGAGSDTITGRAGDEIIDGDRSLEVHITVRTNPADPATESGRTDLMENKATSGNFGPGTAGMTLQQAVFAGLVDPGNLVAVREIVNSTTAPADCGAAVPANCDTAVFLAPRSSYTITQVPGSGTTLPSTLVSQTGPVVAPQKASDGSDTLRGIEQLQFADGIVTLAVPAAPVIGAATAGDTSATVNFSAPGVTGLTGFLIQPIDPGTSLAVGPATSAAATATSVLVTGLPNGTPVAFVVAATNEFGTGAFSAASNPVTPVAAIGPAVTSQLPGDGATGVSITQVITSSFSANVTGVSGGPASNNVQLHLGTATGPRVPATVTYLQGGASRVLTIRPGTLLAPNTVYVVTVTGGTATTGIRSTPAPSTPVPTTSWSFTTEVNPAPFLVARAPAPGATGVARASVVTARFSEPVTGLSTTTATITRAGARVPVVATVTYNPATNTVTINAGGLRGGTVYTVTLIGGPTAIREAAATGLPFQTVTWRFTT